MLHGAAASCCVVSRRGEKKACQDGRHDIVLGTPSRALVPRKPARRRACSNAQVLLNSRGFCENQKSFVFTFLRTLALPFEFFLSRIKREIGFQL